MPQAHAGCYISAGFATLIGDLLGKSDADFDGAVNDEVKRLEKMRDFFELTSNWYSQIGRLPASGLIRLVRGGERLRKWFGTGS